MLAVRFEIPIADAPLHEFQRIADVIIGAMNNMKFHACRRLERNRPPEREIRFTIGSDLRAARQQLRALTPQRNKMFLFVGSRAIVASVSGAEVKL